MLYSKNDGVIVTGKLVKDGEAETKLSQQRFDRAIDPWFFHHARELPSTTHKEVISIMSYLFRYDRGAFWGGESVFAYFGLPNNRFWRFIFNPLTKTRAIHKSMLSTGSADFAMIQDLLLPVDTSEAFVDYVAEELAIWPIWICPVRKKPADGDVWGWPFWKDKASTAPVDTRHPVHRPVSSKGQLFLNPGVRGGAGDGSPSMVRCLNRRMEDVLRDLHGMKVPYAVASYTEEEFWDLYDRDEYDALRKERGAQALPTVYDKIKRLEQKEEERDKSKPEELRWQDRLLYIWPIGQIVFLFTMVFK